MSDSLYPLQERLKGQFQGPLFGSYAPVYPDDHIALKPEYIIVLLSNTYITFRRHLGQRVQLECDGQRIPLPELQGIVVLNIPSFMGGTNFWGGTRADDIFLAPSFDDRILEVKGFLYYLLLVLFVLIFPSLDFFFIAEVGRRACGDTGYILQTL